MASHPATTTPPNALELLRAIAERRDRHAFAQILDEYAKLKASPLTALSSERTTICR
jgi:hypothetical protein